MPVAKRYRLQIVALGAMAVATFCGLYVNRSTHCVLYYYGASPEEVPQGTAVALLNPLRNRKDEANAAWLI